MACVPNEKKEITEIKIDFNEAEAQKILQFQLDQNKDSLILYFDHPNPTFRYLATQSFASFKDSTALLFLEKKLKDKNLKIKAAAAYAIGQIGKKKSIPALLDAFRQRDTISVDNISNASILEAVGKIGGLKELKALTSISTYRPSDTMLVSSHAKAIYRLAMKGYKSDNATKIMTNYAISPEFPRSARLYGAHYLARSKELDIEMTKFQIAKQAVKEIDIEVQLALITSLKHSNNEEIQSILNNVLGSEVDYRIKCNALKTLQSYPYINSIEKVIAFIDDSNPMIAESAVHYISIKGIPEDASIYRAKAKTIKNSRIKAMMYGALLKVTPYYYIKTRNAIRYEIQQWLKQEKDVYVKSLYFDALGNDIGSYEFLYDQIKDSTNQILITAGTRSLGKIVNNDKFDAHFKGSSRYAKNKIVDAMIDMIQKGDVGAITEASLALSVEGNNIESSIDSMEYLIRSKENLVLPRDVEAYMALNDLINKVTNQDVKFNPSSNLPKKLNFDLLNEINDSTTALVKTNKGVFKINFFKNETPQSVANFVALSQDDFFDDKVFHRVVPNFVIQTGCPRGDGYGSLDYNIRSELPQKYYDGEGYVGMASAGNHTESTQWFVTHSATPHLDGRYTIFGKVIEGMDVVHNITVGDKILDIIISNN